MEQVKKETPKGEVKAVEKAHFDIQVDAFIKGPLMEFHAVLSEKTQDGKEPQVDLAADKIAQAMTALQARSKDRKRKGSYGKED